MIHTNKVSLKYISAWLLAALFIILTAHSRDKPLYQNSFHNFLTNASDTTKPGKKKVPRSKIKQDKKQDTISLKITEKSITDSLTPDTRDSLFIKQKDSSIVEINDTTDLKISRDSLDAPIEYDAEDSMVLDVPTQKITLYGKKTTTHYKDNNLSAPVIELDQETGTLTASIRRDSAGKVLSMPTFKQGDFTSTSDSLKFNLKSGKGITKSTYTQQGEIYVYGETIKKIDPDVFFVKKARFTTCNLDTPHFAFISNRIKFINQKVAISGPVHPEFEGVPIPIYLPFGIFPLSQGRHSGFLPPAFTSNQQLGLALEGLGYYKVLSDYWDVILRGNIYSYGGWTMNINPRYKKLYRYQGNIAFDIQSFKYNFKGDPDYTKNRSYHLTWSHSADTRSRPGVTFAANVNAGSSSFNSFIPNNPYKNFSNQLSSSIVYAKTWKDKPFNLTVSANHNQNTLQKLININLPDVAFNVQTLYPFRKKEFIGTPKWYENIGVAYNGNAKSLFSFYDTAKNIFSHIADTFQWGAHHSVPISISLPQIGIFQIGPSVSYDETWYQRKFVRTWDNVNEKLDTTVTKGFYTARDMNFGLGISTRIFGLIAAKSKTAKIQAIRHEIRPTIGINYKPDFNKKYYYRTQVDTFKRFEENSVFQGNIFSPYGQGKFGGVSFGIDNNIQMKVLNKKDTGENALKKVTLIDGLSLNGNYNLMADSFQLSNLSLSMRSNLFEKINFTAGANLDPYDVDKSGNRLKTLIWNRKPLSLGRLLSGNISLSSQFEGGSKDKSAKKKPETRTNDYPLTNGYTDDEYGNELASIRNNPGEYADFNIPWSVNFSYALRFNKVFKADRSGLRTDISQDINGGGTLNLTPKWQIGLNGSYNITTGEVGLVAITISRDMHCWQMAVNLSPIGRYRFFSINISPKSGLLRDLKINRTRYTYDAL
ncbi:MAG: putative LPS assembly protein LptD [Ginsengibacter sp.]